MMRQIILPATIFVFLLMGSAFAGKKSCSAGDLHSLTQTVERTTQSGDYPDIEELFERAMQIKKSCRLSERQTTTYTPVYGCKIVAKYFTYKFKKITFQTKHTLSNSCGLSDADRYPRLTVASESPVSSIEFL